MIRSDARDMIIYDTNRYDISNNLCDITNRCDISHNLCDITNRYDISNNLCDISYHMIEIICYEIGESYRDFISTILFKDPNHFAL